MRRGHNLLIIALQVTIQHTLTDLTNEAHSNKQLSLLAEAS